MEMNRRDALKLCTSSVPAPCAAPTLNAFATLGTRFTNQPYEFEPVSLEIIGAANELNDGQLLPGFDEKLVAEEIYAKTGLKLPPHRIFFFNDINGIGLHHLNIFDAMDRHRTYKLWVYSYAIAEMPETGGRAVRYRRNAG